MTKYWTQDLGGLLFPDSIGDHHTISERPSLPVGSVGSPRAGLTFQFPFSLPSSRGICFLVVGQDVLIKIKSEENGSSPPHCSTPWSPGAGTAPKALLDPGSQTTLSFPVITVLQCGK